MKITIELLLLVFAITVFTPSLFYVAHADVITDPVLDNDVKAEKVPLKTHDNTVHEEEIAISSDTDGFTIADKAQLKDQEGHQFQAEINQLMGIIVNSLYSNRDVFIRELISNSADAIAKIRFTALTDSKALGDTPQFEIKIKADPENKMLHIRDTGIGMTRQELIKNLGSIAKSGTKDFLSRVNAGDLETIGQFGVGFYSSFLVADKVTVTSKHNDDDQHIWESTTADPASYTVAKDPRGDTLGRGTLVTLHLKEDAFEYLEESKLRELIIRYNEFVTTPIYLWTSKEVTEEVPKEKEETEEESNEDIAVDEADEEDEEEEEEAPQTITKTVHHWEHINSNPPLWTKRKSQITEEEYESFYRDVLRGTDKPISYSHFKAEGDVEFNSLLYIPSEVPWGFWEPNYKSQMKLYVKRIFITDDFENMIPNYLNFIKGVVDSEDLPLNVSREMLQQDKTLSVIKKKLVRKIIAMFQELVEDEEKFDKFYSAFSTNLKLGCIQDTANRTRLSKLLKFHTAKYQDKKITFEEYIKNMKKGQTDIYYLGGETKEQVLHSPLLERLTKRGYDVLVLSEPIDEYTVGALGKYDGKYSFVDVSKEGLKLGKDDEDQFKEDVTKFEKLVTYLKDTLSDKVSKVEVSKRLTKTPCAIVSQSYGYSANMERLLKAQAFRDDRYMTRMGGKRVLEINTRHPIIKRLLDVVENGQTDESTVDIANVLYDTAVLNSGFGLSEPADLTHRITRMVAHSLEIDPSEAVEEIEETEDPEAEEVADNTETDDHDHDHEHEEL